MMYTSESIISKLYVNGFNVGSVVKNKIDLCLAETYGWCHNFQSKVVNKDISIEVARYTKRKVGDTIYLSKPKRERKQSEYLTHDLLGYSQQEIDLIRQDRSYIMISSTLLTPLIGDTVRFVEGSKVLSTGKVMFLSKDMLNSVIILFPETTSFHSGGLRTNRDFYRL